jgi:hypothetical protein
MHILAGNHLGGTQMEGNIKIGEVKKKRICPYTESYAINVWEWG